MLKQIEITAAAKNTSAIGCVKNWPKSPEANIRPRRRLVSISGPIRNPRIKGADGIFSCAKTNPTTPKTISVMTSNRLFRTP